MQIPWRKEWSVVGAVSMVIGVGIGYAVSVIQNRNARKITDAIDEMGADVYHLKATVEKSTVNVLEAQWDIIRKLEQEDPTPSTDEESGGEPEESPENEEAPIQAVGISIGDVMVPKPERQSIFSENDDDDDDWDYEKELTSRTEDAPYIIHTDEYHDDERHYRHTTLTYYKGDDVLVDDKEVPIYNPDLIVGKDNLLFGKGSGDESIVFIRNDKLEAEFEVILDTGFYQVEVLGTEIEDRLSVEKPVIHKLRPD
jgi:hypothetical protein